MLFHRLYVMAMAVISIILGMFVLYPVIVQRGGLRHGGVISIIFTIDWLLFISSFLMVTTGDMSYLYTELNADFYSISWGAVPYSFILLEMLGMGIVNVTGLGAMTYLETDPFFKKRAFMLFLGYLLSLVAVLIVTIRSLVILNPIIFGLGGAVMSYGILRKPPQ